MKALVLIWSYATFYPAITPLVLLPFFFLVTRIIRMSAERVNSALIFLLASVLVAGVTYVNFTEGPELYAKFLKEKGVETDAFVSSVNGDSVTITFKAQPPADGGESEKITYTAVPRRFHPVIEEPITPPQANERVRIAYLPQVEAGLLIIADPTKSPYGAKIACNETVLGLKRAEAAYRFSEYPNFEVTTNLRTAIEAMQSMSGCLDAGERERYAILLSKLN